MSLNVRGRPVMQPDGPEQPTMDALLFVSASTPPYPVCYDLSHPNAPQIASDRDRAVLRALLTLALTRLDQQEKDLPS